MQQAAAVRKYGLRAMESINQGLVDPMALSALAENTAPMSVGRLASVPGYAQGGLISDIKARAQGSGGSSGSGGILRAVVVPGEASLDRLLAGGSSTMLRFFRENASDVNTALGRTQR